MVMPPSHPDEEVPKGLTSDEQERFKSQRYVLRERENYLRGGGPASTGSPPDFGTPLVVCLFVAPFVLLGYAVVVLGEWLSHHAGRYRELLEVVFPGTWVASVPDGAHKAPAVAGVVATVVVVAVVAITYARHVLRRRWAQHARTGRFALFMWMLAFSTARTVIFVAGAVAVLGAAGIATGADLEAETVDAFSGTGRWWAAGAGVALWSVFFALRAYWRTPDRGSAYI